MNSLTQAIVERIKTAMKGASEFEENGISVLVAADEAKMGELAGLHTLYHLLLHAGEKMRFDFARAPSQVHAWHTIAEHLPTDFTGQHVMMCPFDEIRDGEYAALEQQQLRSRLQAGVFPHKLEINAGDCSESHARAEATRLNQAISKWRSESIFRLVQAGISPNAPVREIGRPGYQASEYELHLAFHRPGLPPCEDPYMAIAMSEAASVQQENEGVVSSASSISDDWVVTMTANLLALETDAMVFSIPDQRGINLWRMLNESTELGTPATLVQKHPSIGTFTEHKIPKLVICTTEASLSEYQAADRHFSSTGEILGS